MSSPTLLTSVPQMSPRPSLKNPFVQFRGSGDCDEEPTFPSSTFTHTRERSNPTHGHAAGPRVPLLKWDSTHLGPSRAPRPNCVPTADIFGHLPGYLLHAHPPPQEGDDEDSLTPNVLSLPEKRRRKKLRASAGVRPKPPRKPSAGRSSADTKIHLPPKGRMQCLWGDGCTVQKVFAYSLDTIKDWKNHISSHLTEPSEVVEGSAGRVKTVVRCRWGGCNKKVEKGYLFKHIVTHEVRFKLLCPLRCGVAIRDDNLERHLRICRLGD